MPAGTACLDQDPIAAPPQGPRRVLQPLHMPLWPARDQAALAPKVRPTRLFLFSAGWGPRSPALAQHLMLFALVCCKASCKHCACCGVWQCCSACMSAPFCGIRTPRHSSQVSGWVPRGQDLSHHLLLVVSRHLVCTLHAVVCGCVPGASQDLGQHLLLFLFMHHVYMLHAVQCAALLAVCCIAGCVPIAGACARLITPAQCWLCTKGLTLGSQPPVHSFLACTGVLLHPVVCALSLLTVSLVSCRCSWIVAKKRRGQAGRCQQVLRAWTWTHSRPSPWPKRSAAALAPATLACKGWRDTKLPFHPRYARPAVSCKVLGGGQGAQPWPNTYCGFISGIWCTA